ncbi:hypothetical protein GPUN_1301 [Glaciecola punicea ACAM 611]|uniref:Uncharacterized protein n=1 Tax=Glaciecola punicea ACAM 611 TaxID=1121923 RepID=H5TAU8_9ALTE|nr:hypothetical protein GPUN_1301 [Glaciecola punicea ACAM 611]
MSTDWQDKVWVVMLLSISFALVKINLAKVAHLPACFQQNTGLISDVS